MSPSALSSATCRWKPVFRCLARSTQPSSVSSDIFRVDLASGPVRLLLAVFLGETRLIDNRLLAP